MKESPILFSGPLVRAILSGYKTQTRRLLRQQPDPDTVAFDLDGDRWKSRSKLVRLGDTFPGATNPDRKGNWTDPIGIRCPYGKPGDRLWVREATRWSAALGGNDCEVEYRADNAKLRRTVVGESGYSSTRNWNLWTPSIHMPRWASRIDLEILEVRVQRIREITEEDARAEGIHEHPAAKIMLGAKNTHKGAFLMAWDAINGARPGGSWLENPWVWAVTFRLAEK